MKKCTHFWKRIWEVKPIGSEIEEYIRWYDYLKQKCNNEMEKYINFKKDLINWVHIKRKRRKIRK